MKIELLEHFMEVPIGYWSETQRRQAMLLIRGGMGLTNSELCCIKEHVESI